MSIAAYRKTVKAHEDPRNIERRLLADVSASLEKHADSFDSADAASDRFAALAGGLRDALWQNQKVWAAFATSVARPENELPDQLRADILSLAGFVDRHTGKALGGEAKVRPLIDINRALTDAMAGAAPAAPEPVGA